MLRFEAAKQNKAKPKNEEIYFKTSANFTGFANCRRLCYSKFSSWNLRLNKIKKFMKISKFFLFFFLTIFGLLWSANSFAFNLWDSSVVNVVDTIEANTIVNLHFPMRVLGLEILTTNTFKDDPMSFYSGYCEVPVGSPYFNFNLVENTFYPMSVYCVNDFTLFFASDNENAHSVSYSLFYTTSTLPVSEVSVENGFSYGEIVMSLFLFLTFMAVCGLLFIKLFIIKK
jgi:hypothetical protein